MAEKIQDDFNRLFRRLSPDPEVAAQLYVTLRQKLVTFFRQNNCHPADYHADEALSRIARRDDVDEIRNVGAFAYGIARRMKLDIYEKAKREISLDEGLDGRYVSTARDVEADIIEDIDRPRRSGCAQHCLEKLPADERALFVGYQMVADETRIEDRKELAERLGIQEGTLKTRVCRTRLDLERCARRCLAAHKTDLL